MSMTRKEFRIAAAQLAEWSDAPDGKAERDSARKNGVRLFTKEDVVYEFIKFFKQTNPRFDAAKFAHACRHPVTYE